MFTPFTGKVEWVSHFLEKLFGSEVVCTGCSLFEENASNLLECADAFYMGGASEEEARSLFRDPIAGRMLEKLAQLIRDGKILFIGNCGGSMYSGLYFSPERDFKRMNLFGGLSIGVNDADNDKALSPHFNIGSKFAALVYVTPQEVCGTAFVGTKSGVSKFHEITEELTAALQSHLERAFGPTHHV